MGKSDRSLLFRSLRCLFFCFPFCPSFFLVSFLSFYFFPRFFLFLSLYLFLISFLFFLSFLFSSFFGQRPRRGRSPVEHRGNLSVRTYVPPPPVSNLSLKAQIPALWPKSQPYGPNPSLKAQILALRPKSQPQAQIHAFRPES